jgi:hypothetical protein
MRLIDVQVQRLDESSQNLPYYYRSRATRIRTDKGDVITPSRIISKSEYNARAGVPLSRPQPLDLAIDFKTINAKQMGTFLSTNDTIIDFKRTAKKFVHMTQKAKFRLLFFQPANTAINTFKGMNTQNRRNFIELQANHLQLGLGNEIITYPFLDLPFSQFKEYVDRYFTNDPFSTIFLVDMRAPPKQFTKMLDYLIHKGSRLIGLIHEDSDNIPIQHQIVASSYANKENLSFIACQVKRKCLEQNASGLHPLQFSGIDMVAPYQRPGGGDSKPNLSKINFFVKNTLMFQGVRPTMEYNGTSIIEDLDIPFSHEEDREWVRSMVDDYAAGAGDKLMFKELYNLSRLHECIASTNEFGTSRQLIRSQESSQYFEMRPILKQLRVFRQKRIS